MSTKSRPGTTTLPSDPTVASIPSRTESSMSVAANSKRPSVARRRIPVRDVDALPGRDAASDNRELLGKLLALTGNPQVGLSCCLERIHLRTSS